MSVVLVLARVELMFFRVARMRLCFGFVLETALITQGCFSYCWAAFTQSQSLFGSSHRPASEWAGGAQESGRGRSQDSWPQLAKGILHATRHHARHTKLGKKEAGGHFGMMAFVFPSNRYPWWSPAFLEVAEHWPADGKWWINSLFWFACAQLLLYLLNCLYLNPRVSSLLRFWSSPTSHQGEWVSSCVVLSCQLELNHNSV